jgi:23S rRNA pseudouridine1911/1915/1917 synthase
MADATLLDWLVRAYPLAKRQTLKRMVEARRVRINGRPALRLKQPIGPNDQVQVSDVQPDSRSPKVAEDVPVVSVVYEDDDLIVVDKPAGLLTSTVPRERRPTLLAAVRAHVARSQRKAQIGLIHRLDRDASGLLIFSKNDPAYRSLKTQFFHHTVVREYRAVVHGTPKSPEGRIENRLIEHNDGTVHATKQLGRGQAAISEYKVLKTERRLSLVQVVLQTGRKHQIRVHLAGNGNPVVGDTVYGPKESKAPRLMLAATRLAIMHPRTGREQEFTLPIPENFSVRE